MTNFRRLRIVASIVACLAVIFCAGCDDNGNDSVASVTLDRETLSLAVGEKETLVATVSPETATNKDVSWSSDKPAIATVSSTGEVTAIAVGTAIITVTTADGDKTATCTVTVNPFGIEMVFVQGETFTMGSENSLDWNASPTRSVTLSSYSISKYPITQAQWKAIMGTTVQEQYALSGLTIGLAGVGDNYPMYYVSWDDIVGTSSSEEGYTVNGITYYQNGFCYRLSQEAGDGRQYRLPTEAEWEYAARGGAQSQGFVYSGSDDIEEVAWYGNNSSGTQPVGSKSPNELDIYDMSGNVWEWCSDYWFETYPSNAQTNPTGPSTGSLRVMRGGAWTFHEADACRVASRTGEAPWPRVYDYGFRLVLP
ncbi:MAG: SUMF1/EgtB/PvdO family nonheme iron enzyme [Bacteroidales bacterium]|nr:SUMF1/EgtB/PvdO family nonheme iron enzyme [Bacteroidales bacterium]